jgi:hypothetical protein
MVRLSGQCHGLARAALLAAALGISTGCVERRYTIRSNPPGALAIVNGEEIGPTPVSRSFTYYGDREITLMASGYATKTSIEPINAPLWDNFLTEFFVENLIPYTFRDERDFLYQMEPASLPETKGLVSRGQALRAEAAILPPPRRKWPSDYIRDWLGYTTD